MNKKILLFKLGNIFCASSALEMANELSEKLKKDREILKSNNTKENQIAFKINEYRFYWLKFDYYNLLSLSSKIDREDIDNGWFVWLKNFSFVMTQTFKNRDEENTAFYGKYFDLVFQPIANGRAQIQEALMCFRNNCYFACACAIFSCIEYLERSISRFNKSELFSMSNQLKSPQTKDVVCINQEYFVRFENEMNEFLKNNFYSKSLANEPEPKQINRNRIMHGIFTREVSKTDCLKLFVLLNSLVKFDDWINSYRKMNEISKFLNKDM